MADDTLAKVKAAALPEPTPLGVSLFEVDGTVFSVGKDSVSFRAPNPIVFTNPDAAIVITNLQPNMFSQFVVGHVYKIEFKTTP